jgi:hypothetical protein
VFVDWDWHCEHLTRDLLSALLLLGVCRRTEGEEEQFSLSFYLNPAFWELRQSENQWLRTTLDNENAKPGILRFIFNYGNMNIAEKLHPSVPCSAAYSVLSLRTLNPSHLSTHV